MGRLGKSSSQIKIRRRWKINPKTRLKPSAKRYYRDRAKEEIRKAIANASKKNT